MKLSLSQLNSILKDEQVEPLNHDLTNIGIIVNTLAKKQSDLELNPDRVSKERYEKNINLNEVYQKLIEYLISIFNEAQLTAVEKINIGLQIVDIPFEFSQKSLNDKKVVHQVSQMILEKIKENKDDRIKHNLLIQLLKVMQPEVTK